MADRRGKMSLSMRYRFCYVKIICTAYQWPDVKIVANSVDQDEAAHDEPPRLDLRCLHSSPSGLCQQNVNEASTINSA